MENLGAGLLELLVASDVKVDRQVHLHLQHVPTYQA
jgi:hypothetical protein